MNEPYLSAIEITEPGEEDGAYPCPNTVDGHGHLHQPILTTDQVELQMAMMFQNMNTGLLLNINI